MFLLLSLLKIIQIQIELQIVFEIASHHIWPPQDGLHLIFRIGEFSERIASKRVGGLKIK